MLTTLCGIVLCLIVLVLLLALFNWWMDQGLFGWLMAYNLMDTIGHVFGLLLTLIVSLFNQDS